MWFLVLVLSILFLELFLANIPGAWHVFQHVGHCFQECLLDPKIFWPKCCCYSDIILACLRHCKHCKLKYYLPLETLETKINYCYFLQFFGIFAMLVQCMFTRPNCPNYKIIWCKFGANYWHVTGFNMPMQCMFTTCNTCN